MTEIEVLNKMAESNRTFVLTKTAEELAELSTVCLQMVTKDAEHGPDIQELIDEVGDVKIRVRQIEDSFSIHDQVKQRISNKLEKIRGYINENKYVGTL